MTIIGDAYIAVKGDTKGFSPSVEKGVLSSVTSLAKKAAVIFGGAFVAREVFQGLKTAVEAGEESNKVAADTEQVIKSTGSAANVTADQVSKLANAISLKTGVDDEAIQSAQNMLLTFTNLRNEAGKGNDIFNQASQIAVDMGAKFKNGPEAASIQLGKALNDPVKGITALTRVGVSFTDQQKDQIKWMVANNDTMGAQKIILGELQKEFGGQAEAQASAMDKIKVAFGNVQEALGQAIIPAIEAVVPAIQSVLETVTPVMETIGKNFGSVFEALAPALKPIADAIIPVVAEIAAVVRDVAPTVVGALESILPLVSPIAEVLGDTFATAVQAIAPVIGALAEAITPIVQQLAGMFQELLGALGPTIVTVVGAVVDVINELAPVVQELLDAFKPLLPVIVELVKVFAGIFVKVLHAVAPIIADLAKSFGEVLAKVLPPVAKAILAVVEALEPLLTPENIEALLTLASPFFLLFKVLQPVIPVIAKVVGVLGKVIAQLADKLQPVIPPILKAVNMLAEALGDGLAQVLEALLPALPPLVEALGEILIAVLPLLPPIIKLATFLIEKIGVPVLVAIATAIAFVAEKLAVLIGWVAGLVSALTTLKWGEVGDKAKEVVGAILGFFGDLPGKIGGFVRDAVGAAGRAIGGLASTIGGAVSSAVGRAKDLFFDLVTFFPELQLKIARAALNLFKGVTDKAAELPGTIGKWLSELPGKILEYVEDIGGAALEIGGAVIDGIKDGLEATVEKVTDIGASFLDALKEAWNGLVDTINDVWNGLDFTISAFGASVTIGLPDDVPLALKLAQGGLIKKTPGGVPAVVGEGNYDEAVVPLPPGLLEGLRTLASGQAVGSRGPLYNIEKLEQVMPEGSTGEQALAFLDDLELAAWAAGVGAP